MNQAKVLWACEDAVLREEPRRGESCQSCGTDCEVRVSGINLWCDKYTKMPRDFRGVGESASPIDA